jgi:hypothetical protein
MHVRLQSKIHSGSPLLTTPRPSVKRGAWLSGMEIQRGALRLQVTIPRRATARGHQSRNDGCYSPLARSQQIQRDKQDEAMVYRW